MLLLPPPVVRADQAVSLATPHGLAWLSLPQVPVEVPRPVVLILPDLLGADGRERPYADLLLRAGIAVLTVGVEDAGPAMSLLDPAVLRDIVRRIAPGRLDTSRIGLLGFGGGGRAALASPAELPVAALYPSCAGLAPMDRTAATLLLYPDDPAEEAACRQVTPFAQAMEGAAHGWDHGQGPWVNRVSMMPHPDGSGARILARGDHWATEEAAGRVLRHFAAAFGQAAVPIRPSQGASHAAARPGAGIPAGDVRPRR
ncbi:hypothetical protein [Roseomonas populi]|uniref:Dienelactone hydrolase domain-containing protein n=1 Tax=Roseomonas populi TaxID=3121582 RepID=A0ABT1X979_9PROT|nr:hypothetical protein [Roseomonas pecuniae]MCR0984659.1 hypothetical protein [Roseomonas pecuniae]